MKKLLYLILFFALSSPAFAAEDFTAPVPDATDEVTTSGPNTKLTELTQLRYKAFEEALTNKAPAFDESKKNVKLYVLSDDGKAIHRAKLPDTKIVQYTNDTYSIRFKNDPDIVYYYNKDGEMTYYTQIAKKTKIPYYAYYYNPEGVLQQIEVKPDRYHSYFYGLDGLLIKFADYDDYYNMAGKLIYRKRPIFSL